MLLKLKYNVFSKYVDPYLAGRHTKWYLESLLNPSV